MKYVDIGGVKVSAVGLGTWQFGSREWGYGRDYADSETGAIVRRALEVGITFFDTAEIYANGRSERILGKALQGRQDEVFIATKLFPVMPVGPIVLQRARASARRLGVSALDLYQLHWPNPMVPLSRTMPAFAQLLDEGTIRHVGVSNYSLARWQAAEQALGRPVLSNQVRFNLVDRRPEGELLPWAQAHDRVVIAYSPLAQGLLSGKYSADRPPSGMVRSASPAFLPENLRRAEAMVETLKELAKAHDATPSQVALAWLIRRPNVIVIPGASSASQVDANATAADLDLSDEEDRALVAAAEAYNPLGMPAVLPQVLKARLAGLVDRFTGRPPSGGRAQAT